MKKGSKLKDGWIIIEAHKAFTAMYSVMDCTHFDRSKWTDEERENTKNFLASVTVKVWPHAIKQEKLSENLDLKTGVLFVMGLKSFDTLLEAKDYALATWENRQQDEDYDKFNNTLHDILKDRFLTTDKF